MNDERAERKSEVKMQISKGKTGDGRFQIADFKLQIAECPNCG
jgi:hypothetical protein